MTDQRTPRRRARGTAASLAIVAILTLGASPARASVVRSAEVQPSYAVPSSRARTQVGSDAWQLFKLTNASRGRFGVPNLQLNRAMSVVARRHSAAMARAGALFHTSDVDVYLHGIQWHAWGENVGYTPTDVASVQTAFMHSAPHRANILNRAYHHVAIGAVRVDRMLWVTVFFYG